MELPSRGRLIREGAVGALTDDRVKLTVLERQALGVALLEADQARYSRLLRGSGRLRNVARSIINTHHLAAESPREEDGARTLTRRHVQHALASTEA